MGDSVKMGVFQKLVPEGKRYLSSEWVRDGTACQIVPASWKKKWILFCYRYDSGAVFCCVCTCSNVVKLTVLLQSIAAGTFAGKIGTITSVEVGWMYELTSELAVKKEKKKTSQMIGALEIVSSFSRTRMNSLNMLWPKIDERNVVANNGDVTVIDVEETAVSEW